MGVVSAAAFAHADEERALRAQGSGLKARRLRAQGSKLRAQVSGVKAQGSRVSE